MSETLQIKVYLPVIPTGMEGHSFLMAPVAQGFTVTNNCNHLT